MNEETLLDNFFRNVFLTSGGKAMSARRLNIGIRSAERAKALYKAMRRVARGDRAPQGSALYFENVQDFRRIAA